MACQGSAHGPELAVPDRDPVALAETLVRLLSDAVLSRSRGDAAMAEVKLRFGLESMLTRVEESWAKLVAER